MSKSVSWKVSPRERKTCSPPQRHCRGIDVSPREQPTWMNCKKDRPVRQRPAPRPQSVMTSSSFSNKSYHAIFGWNSLRKEALTAQRGREIFRKKAITQLKLNFSSRFVNFDSTDVLRKTKSDKSSTKTDSVEIVEPIKIPSYFINGVSSKAYRRPRKQFSNMPQLLPRNLDQKFSESISRTENIDEKSLAFPETLLFSSVTSLSSSRSVSAPATIASNDETLQSTQKAEEAGYLKRDWKSDILSRYSKARAWTSRYRTNRYFPKQLNLQDVHCQNPYLFPNGLLYGVKYR